MAGLALCLASALRGPSLASRWQLSPPPARGRGRGVLPRSSPRMLQREWRVFGVDIPCSATEEPSVTYDNGLTVSEPVIEALAERLGLGVDQLSPDQVKLV